MTTVTKSVNDSVVSVLNTVTTIANQTSNTITTLTSGLEMLDVFVNTQKTKQLARTKIELSTFHDRLIEDSALEEAERQMEILNKVKQSAEFKSLYEQNHKKLAAILAG